MKKRLFALLGLWVLMHLNGCSSGMGVDSAEVDPVATNVPSPTEATRATLPPLTPVVGIQDWIRIYFAEPGASNADSYRGGPDAALAAAIDAAELSVDAALHDLNLWSIRDALLDADRRGVTVRLVMESDNLDDRAEMGELVEAGIPFVEDGSEGRMHNKFVVIDGVEVWTGSMNFTTTGAYRNRNNLLRIVSEALAAQYTAEFEEMFLAETFGGDSPDGNAFLTTVLGHSVEVYFSPDDSTLERLLELVNGADSSIYFMAFSFTQDELAEALLAAAARGVEVRGIFEDSQVESNTGGEFAFLLDKGLDVRGDGQPGSMHHKAFIIDQSIVMAGSYNFSRNAEERNDENTLIIASQAMVEAFTAEFFEVWALARQIP